MDKVKKNGSHVKDNFIFAVRCSKLCSIFKEWDFRDLVSGLVKMLIWESAMVKRENGMFRKYWAKIENEVEKHNGTSWKWVLRISGHPVSLLLHGHNRKSINKSISDEENYRRIPWERIRQTRTPQPREETLQEAFDRTVKSWVKLRR